MLQICGHGAGQAGVPSVTPGHQHRTAHCTLWTLQGLKQAVIALCDLYTTTNLHTTTLARVPDLIHKRLERQDVC